MSTIESMTRRPRQIPPASTAAARLLLNPALKDDAQSLVSIFDRIDWDQVRQTQCDTVQFIFQSNKDVQVPHSIFLEMTAIDDELRNTLISEITGSFRRTGFPLDPGKLGDKSPARSSVEKILTDINAAEIPSRFAELCIQSDLLHSKISWNVWRQHQQNVRAGQATSPMAPPTAAGKTSWFGPMDTQWINVPTRLAFAGPVVGLCRRICEVNTGETAIRLQPDEESSLRLHHRLFMECKPLSCRAVVGDDNSPFWQDLQKILDAFTPALRKLMPIALAAIAEGSTVPAIEESQTKLIEPTQQDTKEKHQHRENVSVSERTKSGGTQSAAGNEAETVKIKINRIMAVVVNEKRISNSGPRSALLSLAVLAGDKPEVTVKTSEFVSLSHRDNENVSKKWNLNKNWLKKNDLNVEKISQGDWHISGYQFSYSDPTVNSQSIRTHLEGQPPRVRGKKASKS